MTGNNNLRLNLKDKLPDDFESQFILRLPVSPAQEVRKMINSNMVETDRLMIEVDDDTRHAMVRFDGKIFTSKFKDLPCVCETYKTVDKQTFYKTADVSQVLCCREDSDTDSSDDDFSLPHGITPPLKNVRKRRFRKTIRKNPKYDSEVQAEVKRLLKCDSEAVSVRWELVTDDEEEDDKNCVTEVDIFGGEISSSDEDDEKSDSSDIDVVD